MRGKAHLLLLQPAVCIYDKAFTEECVGYLYSLIKETSRVVPEIKDQSLEFVL